MKDPFDPRHCACFNLRRAARQVTQAFDRALRPAGIQATQFSLLAMASAEDDGVTVGDLADRLGMDRTTLTRNLGVITRHGWIESLPGEDRRERLIRLTDAGRSKLAEAMPHWRRAQESAVEAMGESGLSDLLSLSRRLATGQAPAM